MFNRFFTEEDIAELRKCIHKPSKESRIEQMNESLEWHSLEKFIKQLKLKFPGIEHFIVDVFGKILGDRKIYPHGDTFEEEMRIANMKRIASKSSAKLYADSYYELNYDILEDKLNIKSIEEFHNVLEKVIESFSYYVSGKRKEYWYLEPDKVNIGKHKKQYFIHVSRSPNLEKTGLLPKNSKRFEDSPKRIYLIDISNEIEHNEYDLINSYAVRLKNVFNSTYKKKNIISEDEEYFLYYIIFDENRNLELYVDTKIDNLNAYYITSPIYNTKNKRCIRLMGKI